MFTINKILLSLTYRNKRNCTIKKPDTSGNSEKQFFTLNPEAKQMNLAKLRGDSSGLVKR